MQATKSKSPNVPARKPFGPLALYKNRVFLSANETTEQDFISELKSLYQLDELEVQVATLSRDDKSKDFRYIELPGLPRIYLIQLLNHSSGVKRVTDVYELAVYDGGATAIIYIHESAITLFKLATLHNFPCILFHSEDEFKTYAKTKFLGDDTKEIQFWLGQQQEFVQKKIRFREDFAEHKKEVKQQREQRRAEGRDAKTKKPSVKKSGTKSEKRENRPKQRETPKEQNGRKSTEPTKKTKAKDQGWEEVKRAGSEKSKETTPDPVVVAEPEQPSRKSPTGAYIEALTRPVSRENRPSEAKVSSHPQWSLPSDITPVIQGSQPPQLAAPLPSGSVFGVNPAFPAWQQQQSAGAGVPLVIPQQFSPEMALVIQTMHAQLQAANK